MAPVISGIYVDDTNVDRQNSFLVRATISDTTLAYAYVNGRTFQMRRVDLTDTWSTRIHALQLGEGTYTVYVHAVKVATSEVVSDSYAEDITVTDLDPLQIVEFMINLYNTNKPTWLVDSDYPIDYVNITSAKRIDVHNNCKVVLKGGKVVREGRGPRRHRKNYGYVVVIQVESVKSFEHCRRAFETAILQVEEDNQNLNGYADWDFIDIMDDGKDVSPGSREMWRITHSITVWGYNKAIGTTGT